MAGCAFRLYEQLETFPETIEQELRPAVSERRQTDRFKENYMIDKDISIFSNQHHTALERIQVVSDPSKAPEMGSQTPPPSGVIIIILFISENVGRDARVLVRNGS